MKRAVGVALPIAGSGEGIACSRPDHGYRRQKQSDHD